MVAGAVVALRLRHAVVTSVTRDDLPDGGASIFAGVIRAIREASPGTTVEVLIPDFSGSLKALETVTAAGPDVLNHNLETVPRLYPSVRPEASYERSLELLGIVAERAPEVVTKSGIMVGLGETVAELRGLFADLARVGCRMLTVGQYLQPTSAHHPVQRFYGPEEFGVLAGLAEAAGIGSVAAGPLVRSSYRAAEALVEIRRCPSSR
jgi:lipoyl synthase